MTRFSAIFIWAFCCCFVSGLESRPTIEGQQIFVNLNGERREVILCHNDLPDGVTFGDSVAVDTESRGLRPTADRLCLVQLCGRTGPIYAVKIGRIPQNAPNLKGILQNRGILKIFHFAGFDAAILKYTFGCEVSPLYCTKVASKLARTYTGQHSLKDLCREFLNVDLSKEQQSSDWGKETLSGEELEYAAKDVLYLHDIRDRLNEILRREGLAALADKCFNMLETVTDLRLFNINPDVLFVY
ncbi:MAG: ribonuclease D [Holosporaceae bacterium]|jgi:ribonuclease D|nr:ribonuclease D [Holosporaceae bacterium]